jgi:hypothetical protein
MTSCSAIDGPDEKLKDEATETGKLDKKLKNRRHALTSSGCEAP